MSTPSSHVAAKTTTFLLTLLALFGALQAYRGSASSAGLDYYQFWVAGRAVVQAKQSDIYTDQGRRRLGMIYLAEAARGSSTLQLKVAKERVILETTATPFLYSVFGWFASNDYELSLRNHRVLSLGALASSILMLSKFLAQGSTIALPAIGILTLWSEALASDLRVGNVSCIQLAGVVLFASLRSMGSDRRRRFAAGVWLGLLLAFKPNLVLVAATILLHAIFSRDWRSILDESLACGTGILSAVAASSLAFGSWSTWLEWLDAVRRVPRGNIAVEMGNFAPQVLSTRLFGSHAATITTILLFGAFVFGIYLKQRLGCKTAPSAGSASSQTVWLVAYGSLASVLLTPLAWLHYFVLAVPGLLIALSMVGNGKLLSKDTWIWVLVVAAWVGLSVNPFLAFGLRFTMLDYGVMTAVASMALFPVMLGPCRTRAV